MLNWAKTRQYDNVLEDLHEDQPGPQILKLIAAKQLFCGIYY